MREPVVHYEDPHLEHNIYGPDFLKYKGELFTGTLIDNDASLVSFTEYAEGNMDGRSVSWYSNGQLEEDSVFKNGAYISGKRWYQNGQLRYNAEEGHLYWDEDGIITVKDHNWFYKNGNTRYGKDAAGDQGFFSAAGAIAIRSAYRDGQPGVIHTTYIHPVLIHSFTQLMDHIYIYPEDNFTFRTLVTHHITGWIAKLYRDGYKREAMERMNQVISSITQRLQDGVDPRLQQMEETGLNNSIIFLQRLENGAFEKDKEAYKQEYSSIIFDK